MIVLRVVKWQTNFAVDHRFKHIWVTAATCSGVNFVIEFTGLQGAHTKSGPGPFVFLDIPTLVGLLCEFKLDSVGSIAGGPLPLKS